MVILLRNAFCFLFVALIFVSANSAETEIPAHDALKVKNSRVYIEPEDLKTEGSSWQSPDVAAPPKTVPVPPPRKYSGAFAFDLGLVLRTLDPDERSSYLMGLQYRSSSYHPGHWEFGFDVIGDRMGSLSAGYRYIFDHDHKVRPQVKLAWVSTPPQGSGTGQLFSTSNMNARLSVGLENFVSPVLSFRVEGEVESPSNTTRIKTGLIWSFEKAPGKRLE